MTHDELRHLLRAGDLPADEARLAAALRDLRSTLAAAPSDDVAARHLAAITAAAADASHRAPAQAGPLRRWGRRIAAAGAVKVAAAITGATVAVAATGGGLAAGGHLPQPAQQHVSDALSRVGIHVPTGLTPADGERDDAGTQPAGPAVVDQAPPTSAPPSAPPVETPGSTAPGAGDGRPGPPGDVPASDATTEVPDQGTPGGRPSETPATGNAPDHAASAPDHTLTTADHAPSADRPPGHP